MSSPALLPPARDVREFLLWLAAATACLLQAGCSQTHTSSDPGLTWAAPAAIPYGTALGPGQLNAAARAPGTFAYSPIPGAVLPVGDQSLSVTFTPSDLTRYQGAEATVSLKVTKATPVIEWPSPTAIAYGTPLGEIQLSAVALNVDGTFAYSPGTGIVLTAGEQRLAATFTPRDGSRYQAASATVGLTVKKATPAIGWPNPAPITRGTALSTMQLNALADQVAGSFSYTPPQGSVLAAGQHTLTATFTPSDENYAIATKSQTLTVHDADSPIITSQPQDQCVATGAPASFTVVATGAGPLSYQWLRNSVPIQGATSPSYTLAKAGATDDKSNFSVVVSDSIQNTISNNVVLTVTMPAQPAYYVATDGSDLAEGSMAAPFATLQRAQRAMQTTTIKTTRIGAGTYYLVTPLVLTDADRGEAWEAAPLAVAILNGGEVLKGWAAQGNGVYATHAVHPVGFDFALAGNRQMPADLGFNPDEPFTSGWRVLRPNPARSISDTFMIDPADLTPSVKPGALIQIVDHLRYADMFTRIVSVDAANKTVTVARQFDTSATPQCAGSWRVLNDPADLSAAGQFAYDAASSTVYVLTDDGDDLESGGAVAAQLGTLIYLKNTGGITISGLTFSDTTSDTVQPSGAWDDSHAAIMADGLNSSTFAGNTFVNVGKAMVLSNSSDNAIVGNYFEHLAVSGINIFCNSNRNRLVNNSIMDVGTLNAGSFGIAINDSSDNVVDSNVIDGVGRWAIVFGPSGDPRYPAYPVTGNVLSNNVIRNTSEQTNDTGAIYGGAGTVNGYLNESLLITGNRIENVGGLDRDSAGHYHPGFAQGIYLDDHLSGVTVTNNVVESGSINGVILCHGCKGNSASNNVVVLQPAPVYDRGAYGATFATGDMNYNGITRIDLLPSYFPQDRRTSTIVVQLSGQSFAETGAAFSLQVDGQVIGTGAARSAIQYYVFKAVLTPHQSHRIGIALTNGADAGAANTALHNLGLMVNNTAVSLAAPEAKGGIGSDGFAVYPDDLLVSHISITRNIVYRNGGRSQDVFDMTPICYPTYLDPDPGIIDSNLLYQDVSMAIDTIFGTQPLDANSIVADPIFANPSRGDYRIPLGSPAGSVGFNPAGVPLGW